MRSHVVPIVILAFMAIPSFAQNDIGVWAGQSHVGTTNDSGSAIRFDRGNSFGVSWTHFFSAQLATEVAAFAIQHDGTIGVGGFDVLDIGRLRMTPVSATAQWHLVHFRRIDPHLGGGLAWVRSSSLHSADLDNAGVGRVSIKSRIGWTTNAGVIYGITDKLGVGLDARYIGYRPMSGPRDAQLRLQLSPVIYSLGLRWRL